MLYVGAGWRWTALRMAAASSCVNVFGSCPVTDVAGSGFRAQCYCVSCQTIIMSLLTLSVLEVEEGSAPNEVS